MRKSLTGSPVYPTYSMTAQRSPTRKGDIANQKVRLGTGRADEQLAFPGRPRRRRLRLVVAAKCCLYPLHDFWEFVRMLVCVGEEGA
jgi:hypothetical protein